MVRSLEREVLDPPYVGYEPGTHDGPPRPGRTGPLLKFLVQGLLAVNVLLLAMLAAVTMVAGGDGSADTATESSGASTRAAAPAPVDDAASNESDGAETPIGVDGVAADGVDDDADVSSNEPPPYPDPWEPTKYEVEPEAKRMGALVAYLSTNYESDWTLDDVVATLPEGSAAIDGLVREVDLVHHTGMWSRGTVEYVQLGGLRNGRVSNIVVIRQDLGVDGNREPVRTETRVMEVRLQRDEFGEWEFYLLPSAGGVPVERPADAHPLVDAVVNDPRIDLPDSAIWDIYSGHTNPAVLRLMSEMADFTPYSVVVLRTGHSYNVFETDRVSNHSVGLAFDIYKLESEQLVVDSHHTSSKLYELSEWLVSRSDIKEFGSPWLFPDAVAHTFTDRVHHDHLHIGVFSSSW